MKRIIAMVLMGVVVTGYFVSCVKTTDGSTSCQGTDPSQDSSQMIHFAGDSITLTRDSSGLYFQILDSGSGAVPNAYSNLVVTYTARLMDNSIFDSATSSNLGGYPLGVLIPGWQIGLPKIKEGGHIKLLIPSALAWGCQGTTKVPSNAPVYFDIYLIDVI
jgi:FKBP-type peptidyl-prolyl cis-trans isomerase FkpA